MANWLAAPAKLNLTLRVFPRRPDGYHDLESIVGMVDFGDRIAVEPRPHGGIEIVCDAAGVPLDESNLVHKAARALRSRACPVDQPGCRIVIDKRIPVGAGLGGGSSDAATTLTLLNALWGCGLTNPQLADVGATIGSDVALFFYGPLCVMRGRGEQVTCAHAALPEWAVLVLPEVSCSTAEVYAEFDRLPPPPSRATADELLPGGVAAGLFNDLEPAAFRVCPPLGELFQTCRGVAPSIRMSGSGSTLYALAESLKVADALAQALHRTGGASVKVARLLTRRPG
jgi:4-diphosphocytidyl-2-C-methyl-D-erythritol kinase